MGGRARQEGSFVISRPSFLRSLRLDAVPNGSDRCHRTRWQRTAAVYFRRVTPLELLWNGWRSSYVTTADQRSTPVGTSIFTAILASGLPDDVVDYLLRRFPRDLPTLVGLLDRLDEGSLAARRRVTLALVRELLDGA